MVTIPNQRFIPVPSPDLCCLNSHTDDALRAKSSHEIESMGIFATMPAGAANLQRPLPENPHGAWILAALD
jgi:hypothetical protein